MSSRVVAGTLCSVSTRLVDVWSAEWLTSTTGAPVDGCNWIMKKTSWSGSAVAQIWTGYKRWTPQSISDRRT